MQFLSFITPEILVSVLAVLVLVLTIDIYCLRRKVKKMLRSKSCNDLGEMIMTVDKDIKELETFRTEIEKYLLTLEKRVRRATQTAETVKFNAFHETGMGGNQSFATALLNEDGDGTLLSSLYTRDRVSVFSKPIKKFSSDIELTEEEKRAIGLAKTKLTAR